MEYLSCDCEHCKNGIEFPAHGVGRRINCPHCGAPVVLKRGALVGDVPQAAVAKTEAKPSPAQPPIKAPVAQPRSSIKSGADIKVGPKPPVKSAPAPPPPAAPAPTSAQPSAEFEQKAKQWREQRIQWMLSEAQANLPLLAQSKMDKATARKLRDLFVEISDEFEQKASEADAESEPPAAEPLKPKPSVSATAPATAAAAK